jgi:cytoskeleton protein RodZ
MNPMDSSERTTDQMDSAQALTPGRMLRLAREARGLHLGMLAVTLKVPTRQLEALENDQYDVFRGPAFVRAVAQAVCRHLGIDPAPVLAGLPQPASPLLVKSAVAGVSAHVKPAGLHNRRGLPLSRQVLALAALMLVGSAALIWWPVPRMTEPSQGEVAQSWPPAAAASEAASEEVPVPVNVPSVPEASAPAVWSVGASAQPAVAATATPLAAPPATTVLQTAAAQSGQLQISATGDTWLEVRDGRGQLVVNRLLRSGESQSVDLPPPFSVVVGRAHLARVRWRDKDFDLTPHTKVSTARFDIQP